MSDAISDAMSAPLISVIVPLHDVAGHVTACLQSLAAQELADFEAIVIDDGSTDGSGALARAAVAGDPRFTLLAQPNRGLSAARNAGLDRARGDFIAFLDGDDRLEPGFLARLHGALAPGGADWAACAIRFCHPGGGSALHSAIHGAAELVPGDGPRLYPLDDWCAVIRHFPSAWNKLYRRRLIEGLRFDEGTWYEDHAFFHRAARRSRALLHLPEPLYLQTRGRPGQITATESDRVFDQITVLDEIERIMTTPGEGPPKTGAREALARIASRLSFERSLALRDPARRARFAAASRDFLAARGLAYSPGWDAEISTAWGLSLAGELPLSLVLPSDGQAGPLRATLQSLAAPGLPDAEVLVVTDTAAAEATARALAGAVLPGARVLRQPGQGPGPARDHGLAAARGVLAGVLDAGDLVRPDALRRLADAMLREGADLGLSAFRVGTGTGAVHSGFHDLRPLPGGVAPPAGPLDLPPALVPCLHAHPSAKLFRRAFLQRNRLCFGPDPLGDWRVTLAAALAAGRAVYQPDWVVEVSEAPEARRLWRAPVPPAALARAVAGLAALPGAATLPPGWRRRLYARAIWEKLHFARAPAGPAGRARFALAAALAGRGPALGPGGGPLDPYVGRRLAAWLFAGPGGGGGGRG